MSCSFITIRGGGRSVKKDESLPARFSGEGAGPEKRDGRGRFSAEGARRVFVPKSMEEAGGAVGRGRLGKGGKRPGRRARRESPVCPFRPHGSSVFSGRGGRLREAEGMLFFTSRSEHLMYGKLGLTFAPDTGKHTFFDCFRGRSLSACPVRNTMARSAPGGKASWLNIRKR